MARDPYQRALLTFWVGEVFLSQALCRVLEVDSS